MRSTYSTVNTPRLGLVAAAVALALTAGAAHADQASDIAALKSQVQALQNQITTLETRQATTPAATATPTNANAPTFYAGPVAVTLGGFAELIMVDRNRTEGADWASNWNTSIPLQNSSNYYVDEFHMTMRQSRISALAEAPSDGHTKIEAYVESDFGATGINANTNESSSYSPRVRHFYGDYQDKDNGWYFLAGQTWSLVTQNNSLIKPRTERAPLTIDGQYLPGFSWLRVAQVRLVKNFGDLAAIGISLENPTSLVTCASSTESGACVGPTTTVAPTSPYTGTGASTTNVFGPNGTTLQTIPDVVAKVAVEPGFGHYELFGTYRTFVDRYAGSNNSTTGFGYGANLVLPLLGSGLEFNAEYLGGQGIGRYGSAQLPDVTINPANGQLETIKGYQAYGGLTWRPTSDWTVYGYYGIEDANSQNYTFAEKGVTYGQGYGTPYISNKTCFIEGGKCAATTDKVQQYTLGAWWKYYQGTLGNAQIGLQASQTKRDTFNDLAGESPSTSMNVYMLSFRFYPYQK